MSGRAPWTIDDLARPPEPEPGRDVNFCPVLGQPIVHALRVRALPGYHLLSLDAGKEAMAMGFYTAFGQQFKCTSLEYLHPEDKVFICTEDDKAFLNEMSMRYHRYMGHELEERKAERKRFRERAEERRVRSAAHQAAAAAGTAAAPEAAAATVAEDPYEATEDLYAPAATVEDPYQLHAPTAAEAPAPAANEAEAEAAPAAAAVASTAAPPVMKPPVMTPPATTPPPAATPAPQPVDAAPGAAARRLQALPPGVAPLEDLYGDMGGDQKRQKTDSAYANALDSMLSHDFDDDD